MNIAVTYAKNRTYQTNSKDESGGRFHKHGRCRIEVSRPGTSDYRIEDLHSEAFREELDELLFGKIAPCDIGFAGPIICEGEQFSRLHISTLIEDFDYIEWSDSSLEKEIQQLAQKHLRAHVAAQFGFPQAADWTCIRISLTHPDVEAAGSGYLELTPTAAKWLGEQLTVAAKDTTEWSKSSATMNRAGELSDLSQSE